MSENVCPQCGAPIEPGAGECKYCGEKLVRQAGQQVNQQQQFHNQQYNNQQYNQQYGNPQIQNQQFNPQMSQQPQTIYVQQPVPMTAINPAWPIKNKAVAGLLAIFLGGLGIHKFYLGKVGMGILYLLFCWTYVPFVIGFIEGIVYLCSNDENFQLKHHVRLR